MEKKIYFYFLRFFSRKINRLSRYLIYMDKQHEVKHCKTKIMLSRYQALWERPRADRSLPTVVAGTQYASLGWGVHRDRGMMGVLD